MHLITNCNQLKSDICDMYAEHLRRIRTGSANALRVYCVISETDSGDLRGDLRACRLDEPAPDITDESLPVLCDIWMITDKQYDTDLLYVDDTMENCLEFIDKLLEGRC